MADQRLTRCDMDTVICLINETTGLLDAGERFLQALLLLAPWLVSLCAALAAILPKPTGNGLWAWAYPLVNRLGFNFGHASNADQPPT